MPDAELDAMGLQAFDDLKKEKPIIGIGLYLLAAVFGSACRSRTVYQASNITK